MSPLPFRENIPDLMQRVPGMKSADLSLSSARLTGPVTGKTLLFTPGVSNSSSVQWAQ